MPQLEVGDYIVARDGERIEWLKPVSRVAAKYAFVRCNERVEYKFHREYTTGSCLSRIGEAAWSRSLYYIATEKDREDARHQGRVEKLRQTEWSKVSRSKVERIVAILNEKDE